MSRVRIKTEHQIEMRYRKEVEMTQNLGTNVLSDSRQKENSKRNRYHEGAVTENDSENPLYEKF